MIKTEIKTAPMINFSEIEDWMNRHVGSPAPRGSDNQKKRKVWSMKGDYLNHKIIVMCRKPEDAVAVRLRWL